MKKLTSIAAIITLVMILVSCNNSTDVVESGKYIGEIQKVKADETEIYVEAEDGKTLELYFTDETTLTMNGETVEFSALAEGQKVAVDVEKVGKRLDPVSVEIIKDNQ